MNTLHITFLVVCSIVMVALATGNSIENCMKTNTKEACYAVEY
ncbi:MAG: hypothetical protein O7D95_05080 [Betaproteobacteria bacterium]|nr:hypothetical protein [Betaproteobacteria bacterium]